MNQQHVNGSPPSFSLSLSLSLIHSPSFWYTHKRARTHALIKVLRGPRPCQIIGFFAHGHQLQQYTVYAHGPKLNNEAGMALHACLYFRGKKRK